MQTALSPTIRLPNSLIKKNKRTFELFHFTVQVVDLREVLQKEIKMRNTILKTRLLWAVSLNYFANYSIAKVVLLNAQSKRTRNKKFWKQLNPPTFLTPLTIS